MAWWVLLLWLCVTHGAKVDVTDSGRFECLCAHRSTTDTPQLYRVANDVLQSCSCLTFHIEASAYALYPSLRALVTEPFFRFFAVNLEHGCVFRAAHNDKCSIEDCATSFVGEEEEGLLQGVDHDVDDVLQQRVKAAVGVLGKETLPWTKMDEGRDVHHVDLVRNPERFTGYAGENARRVWHMIYSNTFSAFDETAEHRVFNRLISGLHASISVHIAGEHLLSAANAEPQLWGLELGEYRRRITPARLRNMYFLYLVVMRAVSKGSRRLAALRIDTGHAEEDAQTKRLLDGLLAQAPSWPLPGFDLDHIFDHHEDQLEEFRVHFYNTSLALDCIGCPRCRLHGKMQFLGLGAALRILFEPRHGIDLKRNEYVALINLFHAVTKSVHDAAMMNALVTHEEDLTSGTVAVGGASGASGAAWSFEL